MQLSVMWSAKRHRDVTLRDNLIGNQTISTRTWRECECEREQGSVGCHRKGQDAGVGADSAERENRPLSRPVLMGVVEINENGEESGGERE